MVDLNIKNNFLIVMGSFKKSSKSRFLNYLIFYANYKVVAFNKTGKTKIFDKISP